MAGRDTLCAMAVQALASSHNSWRRLHTRRTAGVVAATLPLCETCPQLHWTATGIHVSYTSTVSRARVGA
jgi:hypothetical protein